MRPRQLGVHSLVVGMLLALAVALADGRPATGDRRPATGDRRPATGPSHPHPRRLGRPARGRTLAPRGGSQLEGRSPPPQLPLGGADLLARHEQARQRRARRDARRAPPKAPRRSAGGLPACGVHSGFSLPSGRLDRRRELLHPAHQGLGCLCRHRGGLGTPQGRRSGREGRAVLRLLPLAATIVGDDRGPRSQSWCGA
jgi:hypothetical protein